MPADTSACWACLLSLSAAYSNCLAEPVTDLESRYSCAYHCRNKDKGEALGQLFERLNESLESTGAFPPAGDEATSPAKPQAQVWTMYQLAQHYDMQGRTGQHQLMWCRFLITAVIECRQSLQCAQCCVHPALHALHTLHMDMHIHCV